MLQLCLSRLRPIMRGHNALVSLSFGKVVKVTIEARNHKKMHLICLRWKQPPSSEIVATSVYHINNSVCFICSHLESLPNIETRNKMHYYRGNAKLAGTHSANFFLKAGWLSTLLQGVPNTQKYIPKIAQKSYFEVSHNVVPPPEGALANFYIAAQLHSFWYATASKVGLKVYTCWLWCTQTYYHVHFLAPRAQIWLFTVSLRKELSS